MSKTLKIFLYSLVGALVGVIGFGAISSVTRGEKEASKAPTEITLETFQNPANYTEVEAKVGDTLSGNWYRLYYGGEIVTSGDSFCRFTLLNYSDGGVSYEEVADRLIDGEFLIGVEGEASIVDVRFETMKIYKDSSVEGGAYMDFYFAEGEYIFESVLVINSETTLVKETQKLYQLIPN